EGQQAVLGVLSGARIKQAADRHRGQAEGVVEFAIGEESGVAGDGGPVELQLDVTVEVNAQGVIVAVTHWVPRSCRQEVVRNAGFSGVNAQTPCRNDRSIWEFRVKRLWTEQGDKLCAQFGIDPKVMEYLGKVAEAAKKD